ncbi:glycoside hydrolase family protein [Caballeronia sp. AZ7_KS35]|uniref:glycoside hydrolase family protein n=1 Tax=Caballeronia sp. AZ7_KS35 TaxID=2921762 RepID=UPI0020282688|nr:glycoside hydrolase family protein [Caballeronia sp. AZ7_KS35]
MRAENLQKLIAELRRDEGVRYSTYNDTKGIPTVGVGHNLQAKPLPTGWKCPLNDVQVNSLLDDDLADVFCDLDRSLPWWSDLNDVRQRVLANMAFNLGITKLLGFRNTLAAMRQGKFDAAADGMLNSAWATQVKVRANRLADMMRKGA